MDDRERQLRDLVERYYQGCRQLAGMERRGRELAAALGWAEPDWEAMHELAGYRAVEEVTRR